MEINAFLALRLVDRPDGAVDALGIVQDLTPSRLPADLPPMTLFGAVEVAPDELGRALYFHFRLVRPDGSSSELNASRPEGSEHRVEAGERSNIVMPLSGLRIASSGDHWIEILHDGRVATRLRLGIL